MTFFFLSLKGNVAVLHATEAKMRELKSNMPVFGKEGPAALAAVEAQKQRLTLQWVVTMVEGEKNNHMRIAATLGLLVMLKLRWSRRNSKKSLLPQ